MKSEKSIDFQTQNPEQTAATKYKKKAAVVALQVFSVSTGFFGGGQMCIGAGETTDEISAGAFKGQMLTVKRCPHSNWTPEDMF